MDIKQYYLQSNALLNGHFLLSSGNHSSCYLQSAKVLENPQVAEILATALAEKITQYGLSVSCVCSPALGGILAGYELARALKARFIFTERVNGEMTLRRGFEVAKGEKVLICEDIITTGGSALESAKCVEALGAEIVGFAGLANRGLCKRVDSELTPSPLAKLPQDKPLFALQDFVFEMYEPKDCPMCKEGSVAIKPGSRGN
ncbi:orotate phosphoribosyltransferase [Helicobacter sp. MIT 00-7814]|uniref:orotate phosphoribosyltransferase n=1 Tax=unclassified Helicobacter TaxID=2593540 RepID=UPI000E1ECB3A|nr:MULTISPECIES: orotate phosphoribosyltransferase [unclassified Helicobacter]RDU55529.1 orotate phosphoribosyltransferase [Helicobacter sp. MIT 99-10781]RDU55619.1 orotate phosphoribosyltransferase [Helicobacter sp. MIT 00-7814]